MSEFVSAAPPSGGIQWADHKGSLIVAEPLSFETGINTAFGTADAVKANVYVITGPGESDDYPEALVFPKLLASQMKSNIGNKVVGRVGQGAAKPGQSAPWMLEAATEDDLTKAKEWLASRNSNSLTSAAPAGNSAKAPF